MVPFASSKSQVPTAEAIPAAKIPSSEAAFSASESKFIVVPSVMVQLGALNEVSMGQMATEILPKSVVKAPRLSDGSTAQASKMMSAPTETRAERSIDVIALLAFPIKFDPTDVKLKKLALVRTGSDPKSKEPPTV